MQKYRTIVADPPWAQTMSGSYKRRPKLTRELPYPTMSVDEIANMPVADLAEVGCHLWLWTTNEFLHDGFHVMKSWGFKYLAPIHWIKPSGFGNYWQHRTQTILFGYYQKCQFNLERYLPNHFTANAGKHSQKPDASFDLVERVSDPARLEIFSRRYRFGWHVFGNEVESDVEIPVRHLTPLALDGGDSAASEQFPTPEVLSTLQGESNPAHRK